MLPHWYESPEIRFNKSPSAWVEFFHLITSLWFPISSFLFPFRHIFHEIVAVNWFLLQYFFNSTFVEIIKISCQLIPGALGYEMKQVIINRNLDANKGSLNFFILIMLYFTGIIDPNMLLYFNETNLNKLLILSHKIGLIISSHFLGIECICAWINSKLSVRFLFSSSEFATYVDV